MTTAVEAKFQTRIDSLAREMSVLRSLTISLIGRDEEGGYNPAFVKKVLKTAQEKPAAYFTDKSTFLASIS